MRPCRCAPAGHPHRSPAQAYILQGTATLTPNDTRKFGPPIHVTQGDRLVFPGNWAGRWEVGSKLVKRFATFDSKGRRVQNTNEMEDMAKQQAAVAAAKKRERA